MLKIWVTLSYIQFWLRLGLVTGMPSLFLGIAPSHFFFWMIYYVTFIFSYVQLHNYLELGK